MCACVCVCVCVRVFLFSEKLASGLYAVHGLLESVMIHTVCVS